MKLRLLIILLTFLSLLGLKVPAYAATCTIPSADVAFGTYDPLAGQPRDTNGSLQVTCTGSPGESVKYVLMLVSPGGKRTISNTGNKQGALQFNLYLDVARTQIWGDGTNGTNVISDSLVLNGSSATHTHTIYGRIMGGQNRATVGAYRETFMISLAY
jgi:spore coat protein U-like protein